MFDGRSLGRRWLATVIVATAMLVLAAGAQAANYNPATQSHWGACSQNTVNVPHAVHDLNANRVLAQYARMVGVHWKRGQLARAMRRALVVGHVLHTVRTANHGCNTHGLIFSVGPRTLHAGETVGVRLPRKYVGHVCRGSHRGCRRIVVHRVVVFPTNCWNVNFGHVAVVVWVRPVKPKTTPVIVKKVALPTAAATLTCKSPLPSPGNQGGGGTVTVTMSNGSKATLDSSFKVTVAGTTADGTTSYGPVAAGKSLTQAFSVGNSGANVSVTIVSGGKTLFSTIWPGGCPQVLAS